MCFLHRIVSHLSYEKEAGTKPHPAICNVSREQSSADGLLSQQKPANWRVDGGKSNSPAERQASTLSQRPPRHTADGERERQQLISAPIEDGLVMLFLDKCFCSLAATFQR